MEAKKQSKNQLQLVVQDQKTEMIATKSSRKFKEKHNIRVVIFVAHHMTNSVLVATKSVEANRGHPNRYQSMTALNPVPMPFTNSLSREITYNYMKLQETRLNQHSQSLSR